MDHADIADELATETIERAVAARIKYLGISADACEQCGDAIPIARQIAVPGVQTCVLCAGQIELKKQGVRRG
jgi:phage/conjugal plasmid C-4 type zinc finger TraR family protein